MKSILFKMFTNTSIKGVITQKEKTLKIDTKILSIKLHINIIEYVLFSNVFNLFLLK